jgi:GntR family transcriptional repressor for pyruvate dehydrogenase complex
MPFQEFRKQTMSEVIVKEILAMIQSGELRPGDQIPSELDLMEKMNVSRSIVREALRALSVMNVISIHPGRRSFITSLAPELLMEHLEFVISLEDDTLLKLFETRKLIEVGIASLAAERITDDEIEKLTALAEQDAYQDMDVELHRQIVEITKNPIIRRIYSSIEKLGQMSRQRTNNIPGVRAQSQKDHVFIVKAITSRNPEEARDAMLKHLSFVEEKLREDIRPSGEAQEAEAGSGVSVIGEMFKRF